jgi:hypothetical protein
MTNLQKRGINIRALIIEELRTLCNHPKTPPFALTGVVEGEKMPLCHSGLRGGWGQVIV